SIVSGVGGRPMRSRCRRWIRTRRGASATGRTPRASWAAARKASMGVCPGGGERGAAGRGVGWEAPGGGGATGRGRAAAPGEALVDPAAENIDLFGREALAAPNRRHDLVVDLAADGADERALVGLADEDERPAVALAEQLASGVEADGGGWVSALVAAEA